jgi:hypothetical protein
MSEGPNKIRNVEAFAEVRKYDELLPPHGFLADDPACHALFYYACLTRIHIDNFDDELQYEGVYVTQVRTSNRLNLMRSIAVVYGTTPERMVKFWRNVDMTFEMSFGERKKIPAEFRFDDIPEVKTQ